MGRIQLSPASIRAVILALLATMGLPAALGAAPAPASAPAPVRQIPRDGWKDCAFNDRPIGCRDEPTPEGFRLLWRDGLRMTYTLLPQPAGSPELIYRDRLGGLWRQTLFPQGNRLLSHSANGNRIFIPLRFPCRPPLQGEVGYCRE